MPPRTKNMSIRYCKITMRTLQRQTTHGDAEIRQRSRECRNLLPHYIEKMRVVVFNKYFCLTKQKLGCVSCLPGASYYIYKNMNR